MKIFERSSWRIFLCILVPLAIAQQAKALPRTGILPKSGFGTVNAEMLGGKYASISKGPYALVVMQNDTDGASCSGVLIGPREVLTAAHCVKSPQNETQFTPDEYFVIVGGEQVGVSATYYNSSYDPEAAVDDASSQYDLGMLVLDQAITKTTPIPVLLQDPIRAGDVDSLYGFGTNERSDDPNASLLDQGKHGSIAVDFVNHGVFHSVYSNSESASCAGDSGGGVIRKRGGFASVVGVVSAGTTLTTNAGACQSSGPDDDSIFVDLQSDTSLAFLSEFSEITYASGPLINFKVKVDALIPKLTSAQKQRSLSAITKQSVAAVKILSGLAGSADLTRVGKLNEALDALRGINGLKSASKAVKLLKLGIAALKALSALGAQ